MVVYVVMKVDLVVTVILVYEFCLSHLKFSVGLDGFFNVLLMRILIVEEFSLEQRLEPHLFN